MAVLWLLKLTFGDLWRSGTVLTPRGEEVGFALISRASPVRTDGGAEGIRTPDPHNAIVFRTALFANESAFSQKKWTFEWTFF